MFAQTSSKNSDQITKVQWTLQTTHKKTLHFLYWQLDRQPLWRNKTNRWFRPQRRNDHGLFTFRCGTRRVHQDCFHRTGRDQQYARCRCSWLPVAYCYLDAVVLQAMRSAEVTHAHPEGQAGAVAVALAAACVARSVREPGEFFATVLAHAPSADADGHRGRGDVAAHERRCSAAVDSLGNGSRALAQDTVPFSLWCAARHLGRFEEAMWTTVAGLGDRDPPARSSQASWVRTHGWSCRVRGSPHGSRSQRRVSRSADALRGGAGRRRFVLLRRCGASVRRRGSSRIQGWVNVTPDVATGWPLSMRGR